MAKRVCDITRFEAVKSQIISAHVKNHFRQEKNNLQPHKPASDRNNQTIASSSSTVSNRTHHEMIMTTGASKSLSPRNELQNQDMVKWPSGMKLVAIARAREIAPWFFVVY